MMCPSNGRLQSGIERDIFDGTSHSIPFYPIICYKVDLERDWNQCKLQINPMTTNDDPIQYH